MTQPSKQMLGNAVLVILGVIAIGVLVPSVLSAYNQIHRNTSSIAANTAKDDARYESIHDILERLEERSAQNLTIGLENNGYLKALERVDD